MVGGTAAAGRAGATGHGGAATGGAGAGGTGGASDAWLGTFKQVDAGNGFTCGIRTDGTIACWGDNSKGQTDAPAGTSSQVSAGGGHACSVRTDGTIACWGDNSKGQTNAPVGTFSQVSAGDYHTCGVQTDGTIACWGDNSKGQTNAPAGTFTQVSAGGYHTCVLRNDGKIACWGSDNYGDTNAPAGTFTQVSAGGYHTCGARTDGTITCWGAVSGVPGTFSQVSAGHNHSCGVRTDGTITCWGNSESGRTYEPSGTFVEVTAGETHTCALMSDGIPVCWGTQAVCVPETRGCADSTQPVVCSSQGNSWLATGMCTNQVCVAGSCAGECAPGPTSCDGAAATTCTADGHKQSKSCDYGCVKNSGCASSFQDCSTHCQVESCSTTCDFTGSCSSSCSCSGGQVTVCTPRSCTSPGECGTLGYCTAGSTGSGVCRSLGTGGTGGAGGSSGPGGGGAGGAGGTTSTGGTTSDGGTRSTGGTATQTIPANGLAAYMTMKTLGSSGQISLSLRIDNKTSQGVDMSTVTLRYWYQDEGLGTALTLDVDYASIGLSSRSQVYGKAVVASSLAPGADHYLEFSFRGTLEAQGALSNSDQFTFDVRMHTAAYMGTVDVTNDYSYNGGATGYDDKITLHDQSGDVIWGIVPGASPAVPADPGVDGSVGADDSGA